MNVPNHLAIIMDGNGRWAEKRGIRRSEGHRAGAKPVKEILKAAKKSKVKYLTLYAFSTENWGRPTEEVSELFALLIEYLNSELQELLAENVRLFAIGDLQALPKLATDVLKSAMDLTAKNDGIVLTLALSYGSRLEIINAAKALVNDAKNGKIDSNDISEELFTKYLWTNSLPDPDLLIRTGGNYRLSNFLLWQSAYTELYFSDVLWPDFNPTHLEQAFQDFASRNRRFGLL